MFKLKRGYFYPAILLIISIGFIISSCGGGNTGIIPSSNANPNPSEIPNFTPTPILTNVSVSGYMYAGNITTEDGETIPSINVLDVPAYQADSSGNEPFITQFSNSLKQDYPEDWAKPEIQELYAQLNKTLSESKPLPEYNVGAQVYSVYDDSSAIPVNSNGHFEDSVLTETTDNNVKLEVALGEDSYTEVETLPSSNILSSSEATNAELKSCPEKIFAFPGEIVIFRVTANGLNLKSASFKFVLDNPSIGCVTQPVYLCFFGKKKYQMSYGCLYVKNGLNTPIDTTITAITNSGLSLKIFTEVLKKTGTISGTVFTGDIPLVKGKVKSLGPKACCKLDSAGNYTLPKVFLGHERAVVATWQTEENGQKIKHREEKVIDFFNTDVSNFNFGVPPTPTPTEVPSWVPPSDPYILVPLTKVNKQFNQWYVELGEEQAKQMTLKWLNGELEEPPVPENIVKAIECPKGIFICFSNGMDIGFSTNLKEYIEYELEILIPETPTPYQKNYNNQEIKKEKLQKEKKANTFRSPKILVLAPEEYHYYGRSLIPNNIKSFQWDIVEYLIQHGYPVDAIRTSDPTVTINFPHWDPNGLGNPHMEHGLLHIELLTGVLNFNVNDPNNLVRPSDFLDRNMKDYGVIFIFTHTDESSPFGKGILCCPSDIDDEKITKWMKDNSKYRSTLNPDGTIKQGFWYIGTHTYAVNDPNLVPGIPAARLYHYNAIFLLPQAFENKDFTDSFVYLSSCSSWDFGAFINKGAKAYLGYDDSVTIKDSIGKDLEFFSKLTGLNSNVMADPNSKPISLGEAYNSLHNNPPQNNPQAAKLMIYPNSNQLSETYFPAPVTITVEQAKED